ncbi:MAG: hypothetical protein N2116_06070 [Armatimonadetes bacterium]|nr:hypothetical protein [Armatimonadota bacterium]
MRQQVPTWVAVIVIVAVLVVIALIYVGVGRRGAGPVQPVGTIPRPGEVKEGQPYGKAIPPGAPPFKKQFGGQ